MEFLNYTGIVIISYLGLVFGFLFIKMAPEEKKPGMKYFNFFAFTIPIISFIVAAILSYSHILDLSVIILGLIVFFALKKYRLYVSYLVFAFLIYNFSGDLISFISFSALVFFYGLIVGAVIIDLKDVKKSFLRIISHSYFIAFALLLNLIL